MIRSSSVGPEEASVTEGQPPSRHAAVWAIEAIGYRTIQKIRVSVDSAFIPH